MLGVGDFYYELGVQIIEVCLAHKAPEYGGEEWLNRVLWTGLWASLRKKNKS